MAEFAVTVIGSGSALPAHGRNPSAQVVQYDHSFILVDCGEGTQMRLRTFGIKPFKINLILISHLHGDHVFGLPGLLTSFSHLQRTEKLTVCGPIGIKGLLDAIIEYTESKINYPLEILEFDPQGLLKIRTQGNLEIFTFPLAHRIKCNGYLFKEKSPVLKLRKEVVESLKLTPDQLHLLQNGKDIEISGKVIPNNEFAYGAES